MLASPLLAHTEAGGPNFKAYQTKDKVVRIQIRGSLKGLWGLELILIKLHGGPYFAAWKKSLEGRMHSIRALPLRGRGGCLGRNVENVAGAVFSGGSKYPVFEVSVSKDYTSNGCPELPKAFE